MKLLLIADTAPRLPMPLPEFVAEHGIDVVVTAGDLYASSLAGINACGVPALGVYGNHCSGRYLDALGMHNLHANPVAVGGFCFAGVEGCVRYKAGGRSIMYTQDEYSAYLDNLASADIMVSHCPPRGINDHQDLAHTGIAALRSWVDKHKPRLLIHGHTYPQAPLERYESTQIAYVRGARVLVV